MRKLLSVLLIFTLALSIVSVSAEEATEVHATVPAESEAVSISTVFVNGNTPSLWINAVAFDKVIYLPAAATANLFQINVNIIDYYSFPATVLTKGENQGYFFNNNYYAIINTQALDMKHPSKIINGILYLSSDIFTSLFDIECTVSEENGQYRVDLRECVEETVSDNPDAQKYESIIASKNLTSDTSYLIWVSKADYSVRLFTKDQSGEWHFDREYPCAIGKSSSPTCEGTFQYYEKIAAWEYENYYVGPVMRFNRGYALHSTLIRYNGTPYDDRVGVRISAGCVRMHQEDIQYLWDTVPLKTTVYVSAD
ncbi:MAG: L,D-transpeptidase family protein [Clostridia bacterium]|nr:L,D-transpeptidase family protein [Clostridia bacterium]